MGDIARHWNNKQSHRVCVLSTPRGFHHRCTSGFVAAVNREILRMFWPISHCKIFAMIEDFQITKTEFEHTVSPIIISAKFNGKSNKDGQKLVSWLCHLHSERLSDNAIMCHLNGSSTYIALQTNTYLWPGPYSESKLQLTTFILCEVVPAACDLSTWLPVAICLMWMTAELWLVNCSEWFTGPLWQLCFCYSSANLDWRTVLILCWMHQNTYHNRFA